jgi:hypothetical protein
VNLKSMLFAGTMVALMLAALIFRIRVAAGH